MEIVHLLVLYLDKAHTRGISSYEDNFFHIGIPVSNQPPSLTTNIYCNTAYRAYH